MIVLIILATITTVGILGTIGYDIAGWIGTIVGIGIFIVTFLIAFKEISHAK